MVKEDHGVEEAHLGKGQGVRSKEERMKRDETNEGVAGLIVGQGGVSELKRTG